MLTNFRVHEVKGMGRPLRELELIVVAEVHQRGLSKYGFLHEVAGMCRVHGRTVGPVVVNRLFNMSDDVPLLEAGRPFQLALGISLAPEAIAFIEEKRAGSDIELSLELRLRWQIAESSSPRTSGASYTVGTSYWSSATLAHRVPQSDWLGLLTRMEWEDWRIFELPTLPMDHDPKFGVWLAHLEQAQMLLRAGDYDGCLAECHKAFESVAQHHAPGNASAGYSDLLERAYPGEAEERKRGLVGPFMRALNNYIQPLARHAQAPPLTVSRSEAEFVLTTSVSLFSMLSRAIRARRTTQT